MAKKAKTPDAKLKKEIKDIIITLDNEKAVLTRIVNARIRGLVILGKGYDIPGYDREINLGNRSWKKGITSKKVFASLKKWIKGIKDTETKPELKTPAAIRKYIDGVPEAQKIFDKFVFREDKGFKLIAFKEKK